MSSSSVARRYAKALMSIGLDDGQFPAYAEQLSRLGAAFDGSAELQDVWLNPAHPKDRRMAVVEQLVAPLGLSATTANLLRLLVDRGRVSDLRAITRAFQALVDEKVGLVRATVTSAKPMAAEQQQQVSRALAAMTGKKILLESKVDAALIGGVVTQVGSTLFDGSVKTQLERLRETLRAS